MGPGPTLIGTFVLPIGLPLLANRELGDFVVGITEPCLHVPMPNNPALSGVNSCFTNLTHPEGDPAACSCSPAFHFAVPAVAACGGRPADQRGGADSRCCRLVAVRSAACMRSRSAAGITATPVAFSCR